MPRPDFPRTMIEFSRRFATEQACLEYLVASRWPDGFECPRCGESRAWWKEGKGVFECTDCHHETSVTAGSVMHRTKQPLTFWFHAAYLVTTFSTGLSAMMFQRQMGLTRYETAFNLLHKLRAAMVREDRTPLAGIVEADEAYVGGPQEGPAGRGALGKVIIAGAVEVRGENAGRCRLRVVDDISSRSLIGFLRETVEPGTIVRTDGLKSYSGLTKAGFRHEVEIAERPKDAVNIWPHIHHVFGNLKAWLIGTHHGVSPQHLQAYLNEFAFRFNRRHVPMAAFQTVLGLIDERQGPTYEGLYGVKKKTGAWAHPNPESEER